MNTKLITLIILTAVLTAFSPPDKKIINLDFGFNLTIGQKEDFGNFATYTYFELTRDNNKIYVDSSLTEYEFGDNLYPLAIKTGTDSYELLFEINDRPNKNFLKRLFIKNDSVHKEDKLPTFIAKPKDFDNDGIKEFAGFWDYAQVWGENDSLTVYNPILFYKITKFGLQLDSTLTMKINKEIYGKFYGFSFSEETEQPINSMRLFNKTINELRK